MRDSKSQTQGFDFGTSPHGLPADLRRTYRKPRQAVGLHSLADGVSAAAAQRPAAGAAASRAPEVAQAESAGLTFTFASEEQRRAVSFALLNIASELEEGEDSADPWIQEEVARLWAARALLEQGRPV